MACLIGQVGVTEFKTKHFAGCELRMLSAIGSRDEHKSKSDTRDVLKLAPMR